jgi:ATP-dependent Clp protease adaptor protein ClpS
MIKDDSETETIVEEKTITEDLYKVILLNDDYTPQDFVVFLLETVFKKGPAEAVQIMLHVHNKGRGLCGVYSKQIAEAKAGLVHKHAADNGYPLRCIIEKS